MIPIDLKPYQDYLPGSQENSELLYESDLHRMTELPAAKEFLYLYAPQIKAETPDVAAAYAASYFGRVCALFHYALWHDGLHLDLSLHNLRLQLNRQSERASLAFPMITAQGLKVPDEDREHVSRRSIEEFYGDLVRPLLEGWAAAAGLKAGMMWGFVATTLYYYRKAWLEEEKTAQQSERLDMDLDILYNKIDPQVFGRSKNPINIKFRMIDDPRTPGATIPMKASCCLAYKTADHGYCYTCPRMKESEREARRQEMIAKQT